MTSSLKWAYTDGIAIAEREDGAITLVGPAGEVPLRPNTRGVRAALLALAGSGASERELSGIVAGFDDEAGLPTWFYYLSRLTRMTLLKRVLYEDGVPVATAVPTSRWCSFKQVDVDPELRYVLSRFAFIHRAGDELRLDSPIALAKVVLHSGRGAALAAELAQPVDTDGIRARVAGASEDLVAGFVELLLSLRMASAIDGDGRAREDEDVALRQWEFHDLLFHTSSRMGRQPNPFGGTFRFQQTIPPLPARKPPMSDEYVELYRPDLEALQQDDVPFTAVLEGRSSIRESGERPITSRQLGEFLFRVARVRSRVQSDSGEYAFRIYPGGGAEYELELYLAIADCEGIAPGMYHYAPEEHRLYKLSDLTDLVRAVQGYAALTGVRQAPPQVLITLAARFQRVQWKYESMAYSVILKNVGVLYQTMYLVATAMGLAPCALGGGDSDLFAAAVKTNYYEETSVGEFMLGSMPSGPAAAYSGMNLADVPRARAAQLGGVPAGLGAPARP